MAQCKESIQTVEVDYRNYDPKKTDAQMRHNRKKLAEEFRSKNPGELVGEIIRWQIADGYAEYMVKKEKPLLLVHLADFDAWQIPHVTIRGMRLEDVRQMVRADSAISH